VKKLLVIAALFALAACSFATFNRQSVGTSGTAPFTSDWTGADEPNSVFLYAKFAMAGISFRIVDTPGCTGDDTPSGPDIWIIDSVQSNADISMYLTGMNPFYIENSGAVALDLGASVTAADEDIIGTGTNEWDMITTVATPITYALNNFYLFMVIGASDWAPTTQTEVGDECVNNNAHILTNSTQWYAQGTGDMFKPTDGGLYVREDDAAITGLGLPAACGTVALENLTDWCQIRFRLIVGEGATDQAYHAARVTVVGRPTGAYGI